jgi:hypothetical protein
MKQVKRTITPFSNGSEAMMWYEGNCDTCVKAFKNNMHDYDTTQKLVNLGRECKLKFALDLGNLSGELPIDIAEQIGYTEHKGFPQTCLKWSDDDNDKWKPAPRKPKGDNDLQLCMPFAINDIVMTENKTLQPA